jgi:transketolase|uniref:Capsid scaffolding protein n=1 Tax=Siphoviridae sp. ctnNB1 TaxID=2825660 RepID=A0A8S5UV44_9CAUD|nr:MAG TPA: capsid scaffolding protein [Siphoviridae sp. ctnNB1]
MTEINNAEMNVNGNDSGEVVETNGNKGGAASETKEVSFDDFLKDPEHLAEFDRRVQKSIKTAVANEQKKWQNMTDDKVSEAEKMAQMNKEEKAEYRAAQLEKELAELKRQNSITAMRSEARKMLDEQGINLPDDLIQNIVAEDADTTKTNVEAFAKAYKEAVQAGVKEALKGNTPQASRSDAKGITKEQILTVKDRSERQKLMAEHPELFARR